MHRNTYDMYRIAVLVAAGFAAVCTQTTALAQEMPKRKSGLWELTMAPGMVMTQCVDQSQDDAFRQVGRDMEKDMQ